MLTTTTILRPSFWNVPLWAEIGFYIFGAIAVIVFFAGFWRALKVRAQNAPKLPLDNPAIPLWKTFYTVVTQKRIRRGANGKAHSAIFWGFLVLFLGTVTATLDWDVAWLMFGKRILVGETYIVYKCALDTAGLLVLLGLAFAALRRFVFDDPRVEPTQRSAIILGSLALVVLLGFATEALRLEVENPSYAKYCYVGNALRYFFSSMSVETLKTTHLFIWTIHALTALIFIAAIPLSFYAHLFKTPASIRREKAIPGVIEKIENIENQETFGISAIEQLSLTERIHLDGCTECGRCRAVCPAHKAGTVLDPKNLVLSLQQRMQGERNGEKLIGETVSKDALWSCTTCGACAEVCPARIPIPDLIVKMRRHLALECGDFPQGLAKALEQTATVGNPWGMDPASRLDWAKGDVPLAQKGEHYDVLYWMGCAASYDKRAQAIAHAMVKILKAAKIKFAIMREERCHADWARRAGEEYLYQTAARENIDNLRQYHFDALVTACPHCFNTLKNEYPSFENGTFNVVSHVVYIEKLFHDKKIVLRPGKYANLSITLHDACYLARANSITHEPRNSLKKTGAILVEVANRKKLTSCCGAGGGQLFMDHAPHINTIRIKELQANKAKCIATECPHCLTMLKSAQKANDTTPIQDVAQIVADSLV